MTSPFIIPGFPPLTGRFLYSGATRICIPGVLGSGSSATNTPDTNADTYSPWYADTPLRVEILYVEVAGSATGNLRMGFYAADEDWQPIGPPLADSGSISTGTTGVKTYTPTTPIYVPRGRYVSVLNTDATAPSLRAIRGSVASATAIESSIGSTAFATQPRVTRTYAAFPNPGTPWNATTGNTIPMAHFVFYKVSAV